MANEHIIQNGLIVSGDTQIQGGITGTLFTDLYPNTGATPSQKEGRVFFDPVTQSVSYYPENGTSGLMVRTGQQVYTQIYNATGSTLLKGKAITLQSETGGVPNGTLPNAGSAGNQQVAGIVAYDIPAGQKGFILNTRKRLSSENEME